MKKLISFVLSLVVFITLIFWVDGWLIMTIVSAFPPSAKDWLDLIRIIVGIAVVWATFGLALLISSSIYYMIKVYLNYKNISRSYKAGKKAYRNQREYVRAV